MEKMNADTLKEEWNLEGLESSVERDALFYLDLRRSIFDIFINCLFLSKGANGCQVRPLRQ